jgi:hypothetical protein
LEDSAANIRTAEGEALMATKISQMRSSSPKRDEPTSAGIHLDFEDLLAAAIASVIIKLPKKRKFTSRRRP